MNHDLLQKPTTQYSGLRALAILANAMMTDQSSESVREQYNAEPVQLVSAATPLIMSALEADNDWQAMIAALEDVGIDARVADHVLVLAGVFSHPKTPKDMIDLDYSIRVEYKTVDGRIVAIELKSVKSMEEALKLAKSAGVGEEDVEALEEADLLRRDHEADSIGGGP